MIRLGLRLSGYVLLLAGLCVSLAGCPDNPYKAKTWTKKLNDPHEAERAVTQLEELGDPSAIEDLGAAWTEQGKPVRLLQVIISLGGPLTAQQASCCTADDRAKNFGTCVCIPEY